jgi:hypothetical protein
MPTEQSPWYKSDWADLVGELIFALVVVGLLAWWGGGTFYEDPFFWALVGVGLMRTSTAFEAGGLQAADKVGIILGALSLLFFLGLSTALEGVAEIGAAIDDLVPW